MSEFVISILQNVLNRYVTYGIKVHISLLMTSDL